MFVSCPLFKITGRRSAAPDAGQPVGGKQALRKARRPRVAPRKRGPRLSRGMRQARGSAAYHPFGNRPGLVEVTGATRRAGIERTPLCGDTLDSGRRTGWLPAQCRSGAASSKNRRKLSISAGE